MTMMAMPGYVWFHVVTTGRLLLESGDAEPTLLQPGDLGLVPHGEGHVLRSEPGVAAPGVLDLEREQVSDRYEILRHGGGGAPTTLVCGAVRFDHPAARNLVEILPPLLHIEASASPQGDWMQSTLRLMAVEARELRPGGEAVITRLGDILVIQAIRSWIETDPAARSGWLGALQDPQIGRALSLIHRDPARDWTVATLADELAMSRSAFAARFTELVDEPAMQYVTRWRMNVALNALKEEGATVGELAGGSATARRRPSPRLQASDRSAARRVEARRGLVARDELGHGRDLLVGELVAERGHSAAAVADDALDRRGVQRDVVEVRTGRSRGSRGGQRVAAPAGVAEHGLPVDGRLTAGLVAGALVTFVLIDLLTRGVRRPSPPACPRRSTRGPTNSRITKKTTSDQAITSSVVSIPRSTVRSPASRCCR